MHCSLTDTLVPGVKQLGEGSSGALALDHVSALLVSGQLAKDTGGHALDVLNLVVQKLK